MANIERTFVPNEKQKELLQLLNNPSPYILIYGGSGGGKSVGIMYYLNKLCLAAPNTRIGIFRQTVAECKSNLFDLTLPETLDFAFPGLWQDLQAGGRSGKVNISELKVTYSNGSTLLFGGLDDPSRVDKMLGQKLHTVWLNEATSIGYEHYSKLISRLRGEAIVYNEDGSVKLRLPQRIILDCNPTTTKHWIFKQFIGHWTNGVVGGERNPVNPISKSPVRRTSDYAVLKIHTAANLANLPPAYMERLDDMSPSDRRRYLEGEWTDSVDGALFDQRHIDENRRDITKDDLTRIIVAVDPAVSSHEGSDETGIIVAGIDDEGHGFILEDLTVKGTPEKWAGVAVDVYHRWQADAVVAEINQGGAMVEAVIRQHDANVSYRAVHASRGKTIRAEPVSALYAKGMVHHPTRSLAELEDQMVRFNLSYNRSRDGSPDRLDAMVWAISELMVTEMERPSSATIGNIRFR